jgi:hypothetical protein
LSSDTDNEYTDLEKRLTTKLHKKPMHVPRPIFNRLLVTITRIKVGAEGFELVVEMRSTLGEIVVSRGGGNTSALWSLTQETPATISLEI